MFKLLLGVQVIDISASSSFAVPAPAFAPLSSSASSTSSTTQTEPGSSPHTPTTASQATSLEWQSAQKELAAETASRKDSEKQLSVLNEELQATKKRFAVRNYPVVCGSSFETDTSTDAVRIRVL